MLRSVLNLVRGQGKVVGRVTPIWKSQCYGPAPVLSQPFHASSVVSRSSLPDDEPSLYNIPHRNRPSQNEWSTQQWRPDSRWDQETPFGRQPMQRPGFRGSGDSRRNRDRRPGFRRDRYSDFEPEYFRARDNIADEFDLDDVDWNNRTLVPKVDNYYVPSEESVNRSQEEVDAFYQEKGISIQRGQDVPKPILNFSELKVSDDIIRVMEKNNFNNPLPIQAAGWPIALSGKDLVGIGQTGSGKTLGFILPGLIHAQAQPQLSPGKGPIVLVLAPTRELTQQIETVASKFARASNMNVSCFFGGASRETQLRKFHHGSVEIAVACPGRLLDYLNSGAVTLDRTTYVVLDEADRMLDMGFEPQLRKILSQTRPDRQLLMWSATWPKEVRSLAQDFFSSEDFVHLNIGSTELRANPDITQVIDVLDSLYDKKGRVLDVLQYARDEYGQKAKVLVFASTKRSVNQLEYELEIKGFRATSIHGGKSQRQRDDAIAQFRSGKVPVMVATDIAARGLDVDNVAVVVNFDFPNTIEDYVHRIGRTARCGRKGVAYSFFTPTDERLAQDLVTVLQKTDQEVPEQLLNIGSRKRSPMSKSSRYAFGAHRQNRKRY